MFSIFKIFKKKKVVPHIRLSGVIGSVGKFKQGLNFAGQQELIEKAFSIKKAKAIAISVNSPGGSPVQSHQIYSYIKKQAKKNKKKVLLFCTLDCFFCSLWTSREPAKTDLDKSLTSLCNLSNCCFKVKKESSEYDGPTKSKIKIKTKYLNTLSAYINFRTKIWR